MRKFKYLAVYLLAFVFITCLTFFTANSLSANVHAGVLNLYESESSLSVSYSEGILTMTTTETAGYTYQYWIKKKVETDKSTDVIVDSKNQYIWQIVGTGFGSNTQTEAVNESYLSPDENYEVIVRVKDTKNTPETIDDVIVDELYQVLTSDQVGQETITSVEINGQTVVEDYVIVNKADLLNIKINSNLTGLTYGIYYGDSTTAIKTVVGNNDGDSDDKAGSFIEVNESIDNRIDISGLAAGLHSITVKAIGANTAFKKISLYVYDEYITSVRPVITKLVGNTVDGDTTFDMYVRYADGSSILLADAGKFSFSLVSNGKTCTKGTAVAQTGNVTLIDYIPFTANYDKYNEGDDKYGIYYTEGRVSRLTVNGYDDKVIQYYDKNTRKATLEQNSTYDDVTKTYTITASGSIELTKNEIEGEENYVNNIEYAFYREDASGWVLIKDYFKDETSHTGTLTWAPQKAGTYNIQVRIKDTAAGSYEKAVTKTYTITGGVLTGSLAINVYDLEQTQIGINDELEAGKPYKIEALYSGNAKDNILYMFTLTSKNLGTVYLNRFTTNPYYMFIPNKPDEYIITARVIYMDSFGYKDVSFNRVISSNFAAQILGAQDIETYDYIETYDFLAGVTATTAGGNAVPVTVDSSNVQLGVPGTYTVIYSAGLCSVEKVVTIYGDDYFRQNFVQEKYLNKYVLDSADSVLTYEAAISDIYGTKRDALKFSHAIGSQSFSIKPALIAAAKAAGFTSLRFSYIASTDNSTVSIHKKPAWPWPVILYRADATTSWLDIRVDISTFSSTDYLSFTNAGTLLYIADITFLGKEMEGVNLSQNLVQEQYLDTLWIPSSRYDSAATYQENVTIGSTTKNAYRIYRSERIGNSLTKGSITLQPDVILTAKKAGYTTINFYYATVNDGGTSGDVVVGYRYNLNRIATPNVSTVYTNNKWGGGSIVWTKLSIELSTYESGASQLFSAYSTTFYIADVTFS